MQLKTSIITDATNLFKITKKNKLNINILFFSVLLLPISLFTGPAITEIFIFIIIFSFIYSLTLEKKKITFKSIEIILISFFCLIVFSSILSEYKLISLKSSFLSIRFIILIYAIIFILKKLDYFFKYFFLICLGSFLINFIAGFTQFIYYHEQIEGNIITTGFFGDEKKLGSFLARLSPLLIGCYLLVSKKEIKTKFFNIIIFFIPLLYLVLLTSERLAYVYCIITFFFTIIFFTKIYRKIIIFFLAFVILIPLSLYSSSFNMFDRDVRNTFTQVFPKGELVFFSKQHQAFALTSIELFKSKPVLGIGPNNFRRKCNDVNLNFKVGNLKSQEKNIHNCSTHPHNIFFQLLSEIGLLGIIYYLVFNLFLYIEVFKFLFNKNYNHPSFFFILPVIYYLNPIFPSGNFFNNWYMCFGILGIPFYIYLTKIRKSV